jgi:hypothetical protein
MLKQLALLPVALMLTMPLFGDPTPNSTHGKPDKKSQKSTAAPGAGVKQDGVVAIYNPNQSRNGVGKVQSPDQDGDTLGANAKNGTVSSYNPNQSDINHYGVVNPKSPDQDGDTLGANRHGQQLQPEPIRYQP